eukprot:5735757-Amphidinium_carterae.2
MPGAATGHMAQADTQCLALSQVHKIHEFISWHASSTAWSVRTSPYMRDFAKNNDFVNALGGGKFAEDQAVKAIGMQLYKEPNDA